MTRAGAEEVPFGGTATGGGGNSLKVSDTVLYRATPSHFHMNRRLSVVCEEDLAERVEALAREYNLPTQEALRQIIEVGLDEIEG